MTTSPEQLAPNRTPISPGALATALWRAWRALLPTEPTRASLVLLVAHSALETGHWRSCVCWNLGNVKSRPGDGRSWTFFRCSEIETRDGKRVEVFYDPPSPVCRFRAFHTIEEAATDHLAFLSKSTRYAKAWEAVLAGDPHRYVQELSRAGYFTAAEAPYEATVTRVFDEFSRDLTIEAPAQELDDATKVRILEHVRISSLESVEEFTNPPIVATEVLPTDGWRVIPSDLVAEVPPEEPESRASMRGKRRR